MLALSAPLTPAALAVAVTTAAGLLLAGTAPLTPAAFFASITNTAYFGDRLIALFASQASTATMKFSANFTQILDGGLTFATLVESEIITL